MYIKLPTIKKTWNDKENKVDITRGEITVDIDTSFRAHLKWEEQFGGTLGIDLATYTERVKSWVKNPEDAKIHLIGALKLLYCYINSDQLPTFKEFAALFDIEIAAEILNKIKIVLEEVGKTASKN